MSSVITDTTEGPSPRGRGSRLSELRPDRDPSPWAGEPVTGSIPAWAGEPGRVRLVSIPAWAGEPPRGVRGPSPRGRGSRRERHPALPGCGSIPAWAGEPVTSHGPSPRGRGSPGVGMRMEMKVHPRVGGGAVYSGVHPRVGGGAPSYSFVGPSPRGRGSRDERADSHAHGRSIPAWAGEPYDTHPRGRGSRTGAREVHPRVGGGARLIIVSGIEHVGPSPRGRGSLQAPRSNHRSLGKVHPRVGGGARCARRKVRFARGPSPRGRGSPDHLGVNVHPVYGSIPAWAGEPDMSSRSIAS